MEVKSQLNIKDKTLKKFFASETKRLEIENSELKEKVLKLTKDVETSSSLEKYIPSTNNILKEYDLSFRKFLSRGISISQLAVSWRFRSLYIFFENLSFLKREWLWMAIFENVIGDEDS